MPDRIADVWGTRTPYGRDAPWPVRVDSHLDQGLDETDVDRWVQSACVLCSNGCGCDIAVKDGRMVGVRGRAVDVVNHGRLGPKGLYGSWQRNGRDRLTRPLVRENGELVETDWETAMGRVVERSRRLLEETGPLSHGFYTSGQMFLEEYYALGVIGKAGLGTPHMDGNTRLWNIDPMTIPHWAPPTHAMQIWRYAEQGSIRFLWISATNPAVSLPELSRIRDILRKEELFVVVQDGFRTETAEYADVVLPAALWGEKQGTFTNANRTVHLSEKAVEPPGEARSDLGHLPRLRPPHGPPGPRR